MWQKLDILQGGHVHPRNHQPIIPPSWDWDRVRRMSPPLDVAFLFQPSLVSFQDLAQPSERRKLRMLWGPH